MDLAEFIEFVNLARKKEEEDRLHREWCAMYPRFKKHISFGEYVDMVTGRNIDTRPASVIMKEIEELHRKEGERGTGDI